MICLEFLGIILRICKEKKLIICLFTGLTNGTPGGELMTYTPSTSLLDFDDDILLDPNNLDSGSRDSSGNDYFNENPLNLSESKTKLLESLVLENESNPSAST